jgi:anti-anti-sigma factor
MDIEQKESEGVPVVAVAGRLDAVTAPELESKLEANHEAHLILDLAKLEYISSAGLRVILAAAKRQRNNKGDLYVAGLMAGVLKVFEISGFDTILSIVDSEEAALKAIQA